MTNVAKHTGRDATSISPFQVNVPEAELADLRRRIGATKWPDRETVADASQGVQLATTQALARYWATEYDWRKIEAKMNALPQFITEIDGLDIHFIHVRSKHENALPLIVTHGWPGSVIEQLKIIDPLTDPTAHGASASDAFDLVIPSLPGYGFSGKPTTTGWDPVRIARAWTVLMKRLGYTRFAAQGGDWGDSVTEQMALQAPPELIGIHVNMPATVPADIYRCRTRDSGSVRPRNFSGNGRSDFAVSVHDEAKTDNSPDCEVITSPVTPTWSPRSTSCFQAASRSSPTPASEIISWISPVPSRRIAKQSLPPILDSITRPATLTTSPVNVSGGSWPYLARSSAAVAVRPKPTG